jgi:ribosomal protein S18 acetylase RimI-like enzyme
VTAGPDHRDSSTGTSGLSTLARENRDRGHGVAPDVSSAAVPALRIARHTARLEEVAAFYRDGLGLVDVGGFRGHDGYDGVFLAVPGTGAHLELTAGGEHAPPVPHPESLLVLYLGDRDAVEAVLARLGAEPVAPANPYWEEHGATVEDPDGFRVVLVPERWSAGAAGAVEVGEHTGPRSEIRRLFELAEDSAELLDAYIDDGRVLVAREGEAIVGHLQLVDAEVKNMAVDEAYQGRGVGRALMDAAVARARAEGRPALVVATAAADVGNLRFYQRLGFRMRSVDRDAFTPATGYEPGLTIDGIELRDRVWLDLALG